jgi:hypothetical protein
LLHFSTLQKLLDNPFSKHLQQQEKLIIFFAISK